MSRDRQQETSTEHLPKSRIATSLSTLSAVILVLAGFALLLLFLMALKKAMGGSEFAVEILQTLTSWPVAVFALVLAAFLLFRGPISDLLNRLGRIKAAGFEFEAQQPQALPTQFKDPRKGEISWDEWGRDVLNRFNAADIEIFQQFNEQQKQAFFNLTFQYELAWRFEKIWTGIYGTQISLLRQICARGGAIPMDEAKRFWLWHRHLVERSDLLLHKKYMGEIAAEEHLDQYLGYLQGNGLIKVEDGEAKATDLTAGFLQYLARWNYGEEGRIL